MERTDRRFMELLHDRGLSLSELVTELKKNYPAEKINLTVLESIASGEVVPSKKYIIFLANYLGISANWLWGILTNRASIDRGMLGDRLFLLRSRSKTSINKTAALTGIPQSEFEAFESGRQLPTLEQLVTIADFYSVSLDFLLGRMDYKED